MDGEIGHVPIRDHVPPEFNAARFWLANRQKKRWKDLSCLDIGVDETNPIAAWFKQFDGTAMRPKPRELLRHQAVTTTQQDDGPPRPISNR